MTYAGKIGVMRIFVEILRQYEMSKLTTSMFNYWK